MSEKLRQAPGTISPVIYFENAAGHIVLAAFDIGNPELGRREYLEVYKPKGYDWKEASRWEAVQDLQKRLIDQERRVKEVQAEQYMANYDVAKKNIYDRLRSRMLRADCTPFEREMIEIWLRAKHDEGRRLVEQRMREWGTHYLWICEQNSTTQPIDRMKGDLSV